MLMTKSEKNELKKTPVDLENQNENNEKKVAEETTEEKLEVIKELRSQEKISEAEYQKRKQQLLETTGKSISSFQTLEEKLKVVKELRSQEKITEAEYQKRQQQLLDDF